MNSKLTKLVVVSILLFPLVILAQEPLVYDPLVGIPGVDDTNSIGQYINALYALSISIAALLAVIKIIIAGVKWMLSDVVTDKSEAKKDIQNATIGLLIVIAAVLILGVINPQLTETNVFVERIENREPGELPNTGARPQDDERLVPNTPGGQNRCENNPKFSGRFVPGEGAHGQAICVVRPEDIITDQRKDEYRCIVNNVVGDTGFTDEYICGGAISTCESNGGIAARFEALEHEGQRQIEESRIKCHPEKVLCDDLSENSGGVIIDNYRCENAMSECPGGSGEVENGIVTCNQPAGDLQL